jgi:release factor glutamine methyltransferase
MKKTWTIIELLKKTQQYFEKSGIKTARLDSELLLSFCLKKNRVKLYMDFESPVTPEELSSFRELVRRRAKREPVAYILGYKDFWSLKIRVNRDVLIPRPETEVLVEEAVRILKKTCCNNEQQRVLELGTGSGAIPLSLAKGKDNIIVFSVDTSYKALKVARDNVSLYEFGNKVRLVCGDCLNPFKREEKFDLIVSNPPYICTEDINRLEPEIRNYEPREALDGGKDGLGFYRKWIPKLPFLLKTHGRVALELGEGQAQAVSQIFMSSDFYENIKIVRDYAQQERVILAQKK